MHNTQLNAIVIGAGIAGCSTAYALSNHNIAVTLVERHDSIAQEASGNPVAMLYPKFNTGQSLLSEIANFGFQHTLSLIKQIPINTSIYDLCGQIQLAYNQREAEKQAQFLATNPKFNSIQYLSATEASEKAGIQLAYGGIFISESGWIKPQLFCERLIKSKLINKILDTSAINIHRKDNHWQVAFEENNLLEGDIVVICNANDMLEFEQCSSMPITAVRGQVNFFQANTISSPINTVVCSDHYLSPSINGYHSIGTSYAPNDMNPALSEHDTESNLRALNTISPAIFKSIKQYELNGRVAWRSATRDYLPLAGQLIDADALKMSPPRYNDNPHELPWLDGLFVNAGHGSKGMITAPLCANIIASLITNTPLPIASSTAVRLNPSRFLLRDLGLKAMAQNLYNFID